MKTIKTLTIVLSLLFVWAINLSAQNDVVQGLRQPAQLSVQHETSDSNVYLSWWNPGDPTWLFHGNGYIYGAVTFDVGHYEIATKYEKEDFTPYHGMSLKTLAFAADSYGDPYSISIWTGENGDVLEYTQVVESFVTQEWNYIDLTTPLVIDTSKTYYIGFSFDVVEKGACMTIDYGPAIEKGSLIRNSEGDFISIKEYGLDYNWGMAIYLELDEIARKGTSTTVDQNKITCSTNLLSVNKIGKEIKLNTKIESSNEVSYFNIYRNNEVFATSDTVGFHDHLTEGGIYEYKVSAVYTEGESNPTNSIEIFYDNNRIRKNIMVLESFINTGEYQEGSLNSPGSPGAVKGVHEMDYQYDVASIAYHSGTEILGADPFSFAAGEVRWMYYFMYTLAFPCTHFNGSAIVGGGQDDTMIEGYEEVYNSVKNVKTAISQVSYLEGMTSSTFKLHTNFELVGIYDTEHLVVHTVITESDISYAWSDSAFLDVNFVAREMVPDANGTFISFTNNKASITQDISIDPFIAKENFNVITFIQDTSTLEILNAEKLLIPKKKVVTFQVMNNDNFVEDVAISVNNEIVYTDKEGIVKISLFGNLGLVEYEASLDNYNSKSGTFEMESTDTVFVEMWKVDIETEKEAAYNVYPNPAKDVVYVQANIDFTLLVTDVSGKVVKTINGNSNHQMIDVSDLDNGVYFIQTNADDSKQVFKILKQ